MRILLEIILFTSIVANEGCMKVDREGREYYDNYLRDYFLDPQDMQGGKSFIDPRWPDGIIPYEFSSAYSHEDKILIGRAMLDIQRQTCIRFVPRETQEDYIYFNKEKAMNCESEVGLTRGHQLINLDDDCMQHGIILHELMHVMGFIHEHQRPDRDKYVSINRENILKDYTNYGKVTGYRNDPFPYDYESITHYGRNQGVRPKIPGPTGQRQQLSELDVQGIKWLYNCRRKQPPHPNFYDVDPYFCPVLVNHYQRCERDMEEGCKRSCSNCRSTYSQDWMSDCILRKRNGACDNPVNEGWARRFCHRTCHFCNYLV